MSNAYKSRYSSPRRQKSLNPRTKFIITIVVFLVLAYISLVWILPTFVGGVGLVTNVFKTTPKTKSVGDDATLAPPVFNISYEATNDSTIDINGYATADSKVALYIDNRLKDTITASEDGSFSFKDVELVLGTNNIFGKTLDDKSKESLPSKTFQIIYDDEKPTLEVSQPTDGQQIQGNRQLTVSGKTEEESQLFVNDSQTVLKSEGNFETIISLNDGENPIRVKSIDKAGNMTEIERKVIFTP